MSISTPELEIENKTCHVTIDRKFKTVDWSGAKKVEKKCYSENIPVLKCFNL